MTDNIEEETRLAKEGLERGLARALNKDSLLAPTPDEKETT